MASFLARMALGFHLVVTPVVFAQAANSGAPAGAQTVSTMPSDPRAILEEAAKANGLNGPDLRPWHIKASYETFDLKGKPQDSGTYEEFWISDKKYRRSYTSASFTQTDVGTNAGLFRTGSQSWPGVLESAVRRDLTQPIAELNFGSFKLAKKKRSIGSADLLCIALASEAEYPDEVLYCLNQDQPILRIESSMGGNSQTVFNGIVVFAGHAVAKDIRMQYSGKPRLSVHVETIEPMSQVGESEFVVPAGAVEVQTDKITLPAATVMAARLSSVSPIYPDAAKANHVEGTVIMQTTIGKDGRVVVAKAISGPPGLRQASVDSVLQWKFRPFLILGEPSEVETQLQIIYTLG